MKKSAVTVLLIVTLAMGMILLAGCATQEQNDNAGDNRSQDDAIKDVVIKIGKAPFDYELPVLEVTKQILEEKGYKVEVVEGDIGFMFLSLVQGDIDIWPGVWLPSIHSSYQEKYGDQYELGSAIFEDAPVGWVVPKYVDVDSIADLKGNEDKVNGKLTGFSPGSGMMLVSEEIIEGYDLDLELVSGSSSSMMAEVDYATKQNEPILFLGWRPHTMFRNYDIKVLDDPKGYWELDSYYWGINTNFEEKAPDMYQFVNKFKMSIDDNEEFLYKYHDEEKDSKKLAEQWIEDNRSEIDTWLEK